MAADLASSAAAPPAWAYTSAGRVIFGSRRRALGWAAGRPGREQAAGSTALVCTDTVLAAACLPDPVLASLRSSGVKVAVLRWG